MQEGNQNVKHCVKKMIQDNNLESLFGKTLETLFNDNHGPFSLKTVLMVMDQMIARIQQNHQLWVYGCITPAAFYIGVGDHIGHIKLQSFGLYIRIKDTPNFLKKKITKNSYQSMAVKLGTYPSRRDDLESIGNVGLKLLLGYLPQQKEIGRKSLFFRRLSHEKYQSNEHSRKKIMNSSKKQRDEYPQEFTIYFNKCRKLRIDQNPPYSEMRKLFTDLLLAKDHIYDYKYDWIIDKQQKQSNQVIDSNVRDKLGNQITKNLIINHVISIENDGKVIFEGINTKINAKMAIKMEPRSIRNAQVFRELKIYNHLLADSKFIDKGIPNIYYCSIKAQYNVLVLDRLGLSLEKLFLSNNVPFSLKTVLMLVDQIIANIEYIHDNNIIFRNIKPGNFCIGYQKMAYKLYIIDFGTAKSYVQKDGTHVSLQNSTVSGNINYRSLNSHEGIGQSRRDDMESIGYMIMSFLRGSLPWFKDDNYASVKETTKNTSINQLCGGYPQQFAQYLTQCRNLKFDEKPPYASMRKMFKDLFFKKGYTWDYQYDWVIREKEMKQEETVKQILKQSKDGPYLNNPECPSINERINLT